MMSEVREKIRCRECELVQWKDRERCRRCGAALPEPVVKIVERVVERVVFRPCSSCGTKHEGAQDSGFTKELGGSDETSDFPTMAEIERTMVLRAYERSNRKPLAASRLLGIGKTTMYRKLREMKARAA